MGGTSFILREMWRWCNAPNKYFGYRQVSERVPKEKVTNSDRCKLLQPSFSRLTSSGVAERVRTIASFGSLQQQYGNVLAHPLEGTAELSPNV